MARELPPAEPRNVISRCLLLKQEARPRGEKVETAARQGRPKKGTKVHTLRDGDEVIALRWLIARRGMNGAEFAEKIGKPKGTVSRWFSGARGAPPPASLARALQDAWQPFEGAPSIPMISLLSQPVEWFLDGHPVDMPPLKSALIAPPSPCSPPSVSIDRLAFVFPVYGAMRPAFHQKVMAEAKGLARPSSCFRYGADLGGIHISWEPKHNAARVDPKTGETFEKRYARIDVYAETIQKGVPVFSLFPWLALYAKPKQIEVTLIDFAIDYDLPSMLVLHDDRRVHRFEILRPDNKWIRNAALQARFGSKSAERMIRTYDKILERADRVLKKTDLRAILQEEASMYADLDGMEGAPGPEVVIAKLRRPDYRGWVPQVLRGRRNIHRVEASLRPRRHRRVASGPELFDRRPPGLIARLLDRYEPFRSHYLGHLGLIPGDSFWRVPLVGAKLIGADKIREEFATLSKGKDAFNRQVEELAERTAAAGIMKPEKALALAAPFLQAQLENVVSPSKVTSLSGLMGGGHASSGLADADDPPDTEW